MRRQSLVSLIIFGLAILACGGQFVRGGGPPGLQPLATDTRAPTRAVPTQAPSLTPPGPRTPAPTLDLGAFLLTEAFAGHTPPATTGVESTAATAPATAPAGGTLNPLPTLAGTPLNAPTAAPTLVIASSPVLIPNAVNTATCKIRNLGDCTPSMARGVTLFFTWTFGVQGSETFQWGNAAVIVDRDGQPFKWSQANNGLRPPPKEGESSRLLTGQQAEFRAALESAEPGAYTARLTMCLNPVADCNAGTGWQDVGGDTIQFVIRP
jgi:hypothetical protein